MVFAGQDAWRKHPMLTGCYKRPFPGFTIALGIFAGYCIIDGAIKYVSGELKSSSSITLFLGTRVKKRNDC